MSEFKGTPQPWKRDYNNSDTGEGQWQIAGPAEIHYPYNCYRGEEEKAIADANLIAAAPDLLDALANIVNNTTHFYSALEVEHGFDGIELIEVAQAAINKALGE